MSITYIIKKLLALPYRQSPETNFALLSLLKIKTI